MGCHEDKCIYSFYFEPGSFQHGNFPVTWNLELGYGWPCWVFSDDAYVVQRGTAFSAFAFFYLGWLATVESVKPPSHIHKAKQGQNTPVSSCLSIFQAPSLPAFLCNDSRHTSCSFHGRLGCHHLRLWTPLCLDGQAPRNTPSATLSLGPTEEDPCQ